MYAFNNQNGDSNFNVYNYRNRQNNQQQFSQYMNPYNPPFGYNDYFIPHPYEYKEMYQ